MINLKTEEDIRHMIEGGKILVKVIEELVRTVKPGVSTLDINNLARELINKYNAKPSFLGYNHYPATVCTSMNDEVVHGLPSERKLKEGDILGLDIGVFYQGFHTDAAVTVPVGKIDESKTDLLKTTHASLQAGMKVCVPGNKVSDISREVEKVLQAKGYGVVRDCTGHGIGKKLHESPIIPNFTSKTSPKEEIILRSGMTLCIEPIANEGSPDIYMTDDGWTLKTQDGSCSAHFEETLAIVGENIIRITNLDSITNF